MARGLAVLAVAIGVLAVVGVGPRRGVDAGSKLQTPQP